MWMDCGCSVCIHFCAVDWKSHNREYYECSRYKSVQLGSDDSAQSKAREALNRYLFYFERVGATLCLPFLSYNLFFLSVSFRLIVWHSWSFCPFVNCSGLLG